MDTADMQKNRRGLKEERLQQNEKSAMLSIRERLLATGEEKLKKDNLQLEKEQLVLRNIHSKSEKVCGTTFSVKKEKVRKSRRHFGSFGVILGPFWVILGSYLGHFGPFCGIFGQICGKFKFFCGIVGVTRLVFRMYAEERQGSLHQEERDGSQGRSES